MARLGPWLIRMGHLATGNPLKSSINQATPPHMATLATTLGDGAWVLTGWRTSEDYRRKMGVALRMTGREGGGILVSNNGLCLTLVGTVGLSRPGNLPRTWRSPDLKSRLGTGNLPLAGNKTNTTALISTTGTSAINIDRATVTPTSLVTLTTITTTTAAVIDRGRTRGRSGKTRISSEENGSSRMTRTPTSLCSVPFVPSGLRLFLNQCKFSAGHVVTRISYRTPIKYHSSVVSSARDRGQRHLRTPSTLGGAPMEEGRGQDPRLQNVYDIVSALPGTTPVPSTSARSGRRTGVVTTNRIARGGALGGKARPLRIRPHRGA